MTMMQVQLRKNNDRLGFEKVIVNPARKETLMLVIRRKTSDARTSLRNLVYAHSVFHATILTKIIVIS